MKLCRLNSFKFISRQMARAKFLSSILTAAFLSVCVITSATVTSATVSAQEVYAQENHFESKKQIIKLFRQLDLSFEQKFAVRGIMRNTKDQIPAIREDAIKMRSEILGLMESGNISQQSIEAVLDQYEDALRRIAKSRGNTINGIYTILTDTQREKAKELMAQREARLAAIDPEQRLAKIADKLDFSAQQTAQMTALLPQMIEARTDLRNAVKAFRSAKKQLITSGEYSESHVDALFDEHFTDIKGNLFAVILAYEQAFQLLTDAQRDKVKRMRGKVFLMGVL